MEEDSETARKREIGRQRWEKELAKRKSKAAAVTVSASEPTSTTNAAVKRDDNLPATLSDCHAEILHLRDRIKRIKEEELDLAQSEWMELVNNEQRIKTQALEEAAEMVAAKEREIDDMRAQQFQLRVQLERQVESVKDLQREIDALRKTVSERDMTVKELESRVRQRDEKLFEVDAERNELIRQLSNSDNERSKLAKDVSRLEKEKLEVQEELNEAGEQYHEIIGAHEKSIQNLTAQVAALTAERDRASEERTAMQQSLTVTVAQFERQIESLTVEKDQVIRSLHDLQESLRGTSSQQDQLVSALAERDEALHALEVLQQSMNLLQQEGDGKLISLTRERDDALQAVETLQQALEEANSRNQESISAKSTEVQQLMTEFETLQQSWHATSSQQQQEMASISAERAAALRSVQELQQSVATMEEEHRHMIAALVSERDAAANLLVSQHEQALRSLADEKDQALRELTDLRHVIADHATSASRHEEALRSLTQERDQAVKELTDLRKDISYHKQHENELEAERDRATVALQELRQTLGASQFEQEQRMSSLTSSRDQAVQELQQARALLSETERQHENTVSKLRDSVRRLSEEVDSLRLDREQLQKVSHEFEVEILSLRTRIQDEEDLRTTQSTEEANRITVLQQETSDLVSQLHNVEEQFEAFRSSSAVEIDELSLKYAALQKENAHSLTTVAQQVAEIRRLSERISELEAAFETAEADRPRFAAEISKRDDVLNVTAQQLEAVSKERDDLTTALASLQSRLNSTEHELERLQQQLSAEKAAASAATGQLLEHNTSMMELQTALQAAQRRVTESQERNSELANVLQLRQSEISDLTLRVDTLTASHSNLGDEIRSMQRLLADKDSALTAAAERIRETDNLVERLRADVSHGAQALAVTSQDLGQQLQKYMDVNQTLSEEVAVLTADKDRLSADLLRMQREKDALSLASQSSTNERIVDLERLLGEAAQKELDFVRQCESQTTLLHDLRNKVASLEDENSTFFMVGKEREEEVLRAKDEIADLQSAVTSLELDARKNASLVQELEEARAEVVRLKAMVEHQHVDAQNYVQQVQTLESSILDEKRRVVVAEENLQASLASEQSAIAACESAKEKLKVTLAALESAQQMVQSLTAARDTLETEHAAELSRVEGRSRDLATQLSTLQGEHESLRAQLENQRVALNERAVGVSSDLAAANATVSDLQATVERLSREREDLTSQIAELKHQVVVASDRVQVDELRRQLADLQSHNQLLKEANSNAGDEVEQTEIALQEANDKHSALLREYDAFKLSSAEAIQSLSAERDSLNEQVEQLMSETVSFEDHITKISEQHARELASLQAQVNAARKGDQLQQLTRTLEEQQQAMLSMQKMHAAQVGSLQDQLHTAEDARSKLEYFAAEQADRISELEAEVLQLNQEQENLENVRSQLTAEENALSASVSSMAAERAQDMERIQTKFTSEKQAITERYEEEIDSLNKQLAEAISEKIMADEAVANRESEKEQFLAAQARELQILNNEIASLSSRLSTAGDLQERVQQLEMENAKLLDEKSSAEAEASAVRHQLELLQVDLKEQASLHREMMSGLEEKTATMAAEKLELERSLRSSQAARTELEMAKRHLEHREEELLSQVTDVVAENVRIVMELESLRSAPKETVTNASTVAVATDMTPSKMEPIEVRQSSNSPKPSPSIVADRIAMVLETKLQSALAQIRDRDYEILLLKDKVATLDEQNSRFMHETADLAQSARSSMALVDELHRQLASVRSKVTVEAGSSTDERSLGIHGVPPTRSIVPQEDIFTSADNAVANDVSMEERRSLETALQSLQYAYAALRDENVRIERARVEATAWSSHLENRARQLGAELVTANQRCDSAVQRLTEDKIRVEQELQDALAKLSAAQSSVTRLESEVSRTHSGNGNITLVAQKSDQTKDVAIDYLIQLVALLRDQKALLRRYIGHQSYKLLFTATGGWTVERVGEFPYRSSRLRGIRGIRLFTIVGRAVMFSCRLRMMAAHRRSHATPFALGSFAAYLRSQAAFAQTTSHVPGREQEIAAYVSKLKQVLRLREEENAILKSQLAQHQLIATNAQYASAGGPVSSSSMNSSSSMFSSKAQQTSLAGLENLKREYSALSEKNRSLRSELEALTAQEAAERRARMRVEGESELAWRKVRELEERVQLLEREKDDLVRQQHSVGYASYQNLDRDFPARQVSSRVHGMSQPFGASELDRERSRERERFVSSTSSSYTRSSGIVRSSYRAYP